MRLQIDMDVPTTLDEQLFIPIPRKTSGVCRVYISGKWTSGKDLKVQYTSDKRTAVAAVWTAVAGNVTGAGGTWVKAAKDVPEEALFVALYAVHALTPDATYPVRAWLVVDEGPPA